MLRTKKSPGGDRGGGLDDRAGSSLSTSDYTTTRVKTQYISGMVDLSLDRIDHHLARAAELRRRAEWHDRQAASHRAIKRELETLIYPVNRGLS